MLLTNNQLRAAGEEMVDHAGNIRPDNRHSDPPAWTAAMGLAAELLTGIGLALVAAADRGNKDAEADDIIKRSAKIGTKRGSP